MSDPKRWPKPDYKRIAELEIELQDGPAWDQACAVEEAYTARDAEMMRLKDENPEEFFRQIAYDTWRREEQRDRR